MRRFKFTLESVLTVRKKVLEDARVKLANITNIFNKQNEILNEMHLALENIRNESEKCLLEDTFSPCLISNYSSFANKIMQDITTQKLIIEKTKIDLLKQQQITKQAYIQVKSLEKLKEKQKAQYDKDVLQEEFKLIDDIVNSRRIIA
ncbi:MAG: flagellar export protein FliJ [Candidatus Gastranaerophilales bacterium]|nr:flagellar export protein FliJ [Candidatus Gastranaerophilales bacterium]